MEEKNTTDTDIPKIRVLLADDHPALRMGLRVLLDQSPDITVIAETGNGVEALAQIEALRPEVAVLDCLLPGLSGPEVAAASRQRGLPTRVLALSGYRDEPYVQGMIAAGAMGYLLKEEAPSAIVTAVRAVARGESLWTPDQIASARRWEEIETRWASLTGREQQVLLLVAKGKSNKEIARELKIQIRTVEAHLTNLLQKLNLTSRQEAAAFAWQHKLVIES